MTYVVCESTAAITTHLRELGSNNDNPVKYAGHWPRPKALCGTEISWDTKLPIETVRCRTCRDRAGLGMQKTPGS